MTETFRTGVPVAVVPAIETPIRFAEMTLPGPIWVSEDETDTPSSRLPSTSPPSPYSPMMLLAITFPSAAEP